MAKKILKNRTQFTSTLKNELYEELKKLSDNTSIPISRLLDMGVENILKEYGKNKD
jgi:predicted DNA-binding protein